MWLILTLIGIILALVYFGAQYRLDHWKRRGIPHDVASIPKGNAGNWPEKSQLGHLFKDYYLKYKNSGSPFAGFHFFFTKSVVLTDMELVKQVLIKDFNNFEDRGIFSNETDDPLSATLFSMEGQKWRHLRHKLTPTFTSGKMKLMIPIIFNVAEVMNQIFKEKLDSPKELEVTNLVARYTADVIGTCAFGLDCNSQREPNAEFVSIGKRAITERRYNGLLDFFIFGFPKLSRRLRLKITVEEVEEFYLRIVRETIDYRLKSKEKRHDFMDMLIEMYQKQQEGNAKDGLTFEELAAQAFIFFVAGFETSSTTMGFALYELALHQEIQDKLRAEIKEILGKHNNVFTYDNVKEMKYMEQVVMETLRKYPVLPHLTRKANSDYLFGEPKYYIEKDSVVIIPALGIHYDPDIYSEPEKFKPERFTDAEISARPACSWLPFGDGPRNCIGSRFGLIQTCVGLSHLIKDFKFSASPSTQVPIKFDTKNILLSSVNGIHLNVEKI